MDRQILQEIISKKEADACLAAGISQFHLSLRLE